MRNLVFYLLFIFNYQIIKMQSRVESQTLAANSAEFGHNPISPGVHNTRWTPEERQSCTRDSIILQDLLLSNVYNKHRLPDPNGVTVTVEMWVQEITSVREITSDFEMDLYVNEIWTDPALIFSHLNPCNQNITLNEEVYTHLWTPRSCFINTKRALLHSSPFRNIAAQVLPNGTVSVIYRVNILGPCRMDLSNFPMDIQQCTLEYGSFSYHSVDVRLKWRDMPNPISAIDNFTLPDFVLIAMENRSDLLVVVDGVYDTIYATFVFQRRYTWYILQGYVPSYMILFVSWISFALGPKTIPSRTMLGINSLLAMIVMFGNIMKNLPRVSYVTAFDVWMLGCITFVFLSLLELGTVVWLSNYSSAMYSPKREGNQKRKSIAYIGLSHLPAYFGSLLPSSDKLSNGTEEQSKINPSQSANLSDQTNRCTEDTTIINQLLSEHRYNKHQLPKNSPVTVNVEFWVQEISAIAEITGDFELDLYINEIWLDSGLAYENLTPCKNNISFSHEIFSKIWTPNSCFINSKHASIHDSPFRNVFLLVYQNGTVWANYRVKVKGPCEFDLSNFPMDIQRCTLAYESFSYNRDEVQLHWADMPNPIWAVKNFSLPDFVLTGMEHRAEMVDEFRRKTLALFLAGQFCHSQQYRKYKRILTYPGGAWNELYATFIFKRRFVWYILQAYIPSYWISFTLGLKATPARTMLGVNSLLAMVILFGNIMRNLPRVSYVTAFDVWMLGCITFIFCSMVELAVVEMMAKEPISRNSQKKRSRRDQYVSVGVNTDPSREMVESYTMFYHECLTCKARYWTADRVDKASCIGFPALFALFNILYWGYYALT